MGVTNRHILQQGPVLAALGRTALLALRQRAVGGIAPALRGGATSIAQPAAAPAPALPGPEIRTTRSPLPRKLIDDYVRLVGGDPRAHRGEVPPHLFPQWCMPALARTLESLPYPLLRVVNGGCRVRVQAAIPDREPLEVRARLQDVDADGRRAVLHQYLTTGTRSAPEALAIDFYAIVPIAAPGGDGRGEPGNGHDRGPASEPAAPDKKPRARVPEQAREIARMRLRHDTGLAFAKLTGDFNPIHWLPPYARASGFPDVILHGFGSLAIAWEALARNLFGGDVHALAAIDVKLTRPLVLPHEVGVYVQSHEVFVGDAPGGPAYLTGHFDPRGES